MATHMYRTQVARKPHACIGGDTIQPGEQYVTEIVPPWTPSREDPDGPVVPLGTWVVARYHRACWISDAPYL